MSHNKLYIVFLLFISSLCSSLTHSAWAQDTTVIVDYNEPKKYEIGGVVVEGAKTTDEDAIKSVAGLQAGKVVTIPGQEVTDAITTLWELNLFTNVEIYLERTLGEIAFLKIKVEERPRYARHSYRNIKKRYHDDMNDVVTKFLSKGSIVTANTINNIETGIEEYFAEKGYLDAEVKVEEMDDPVLKDAVQLIIEVQRNDRVKIQDISFDGNTNVKARKLRNKMKNTRKKSRLFAKSRFTEDGFDEDQESLVNYYRSLGYRDMRITGDSVWREEDGDMQIRLDIHEGQQYYFRNISWKGNTLYEDAVLNNILGIEKGDVYNLEELNERLTFSLDGRDVGALYQDDGYLFFRAEPVEVAIDRDSIDIEMRIFEGPQATIERVVISGNDRTHEHVIRRELRTLPGKKFSRSDIIRSQRQLTNLGYFDPEQLGINTPVNPQRYTVDIEYDLVERPSDQLELSAGWGGFSGLILTLGVTFNNFSMRNLWNGEAWKPVPVGDGQRLSLRAQTNGRFFQSYNASFTEPWLGGKKPTSFSVGGAYTRINRLDRAFEATGYLSIARIFSGIGTRLRWPDDNFLINATLSYENYQLDDYPNQFIYDGVNVSNGSYNNLSIELRLARTSINEQIFPTSGSEIALTAKFTPPYSTFRKDNFYDDVSIQDRFRWLEYHKWRLDMDWYQTIVGKLVFRANAKIGILGYYNERTGVSPFERFLVGGNGLNNQQVGIAGVDIISLRGYEVDDLEVNAGNNLATAGTATVFNKYTLELRYPISLNPSATIFVLGFVQGGNAWDGLDRFNPFDLRRSAGLGLRVFLPMFGLLGFDYGIGFDKPELTNTDANWPQYGQFNLILGFEPD
jgi:outer membrane protein insertion porin family